MKVFKNIFFAVICIFLFINILSGQTISVKGSKYSGSSIKFAGHLGDNIYLEREVNTDENGNCLIYNKELSSGIYYLIFPDSTSFELFYDEKYPGKISLSLNGNSMVITEAPAPTSNYAEYNTILSDIIVKQDSLRFHIRQADTKKKHKKSLELYRNYLTQRKDSLTKAFLEEHKGEFLGVYMQSQVNITVPEFKPTKDIQNQDSAKWAWRTSYYQKHYLDNVRLDDERLIRTPVYTAKVNTYLDKITLQKPENINASIDLVLSQADENPKTKSFLTDYILTKYGKLKYSPIYEVAYLHTIETYYLRNNAEWVSNNDIMKLSNEHTQLKPLIIGQVAPKIDLYDINKNSTSLDSVNTEHIIIYFFNTDCEHCKQTTRELKRLIAPYDSTFVEIFAVCVGDSDENCIQYIKEKNLVNWTCNVGDKKTNDIALKYNLAYTPTIFLLNRDKTILSKNLTVTQLSDILKSRKQ